ncbi:translation initiation factor IF-2 [Buchnera aphidicola str. Bp (Baizongia pistaciae)]|uniref:Translation initiation factor IF-2 n=1 Tax=Buchnera aphidicola subsp. Baizongia pistaciae (strain Bp) TaxID=224915 RepID=IF2_BUCBP|nr:translation initiation factor IF-2 [Buchnera aphidicola]Q89AF5.1 RecName: Full=Translation initiation factor IF-2 [Buchnera aphidicola str. Bp (Baizongia pistaciae)]AAO27061.1 translation initiation factor IF-2 [Buchnera aphidicola str. Bp (Baizongia pistaciae)]
MEMINIQDLANEVDMSVDRLVQVCIKIGILKTKYDTITQLEKLTILNYLNENLKNSNKNVLMLKRKIRSTVKIFSSGGKNKCISIEIRKNKRYSKSNDDIKTFLEKNKDINLNKSEIVLSAKEDSKIFVSHSKDNINSNINDTCTIRKKFNKNFKKQQKINILSEKEDKNNLDNVLNVEQGSKKKINFKNVVLEEKKENKVKFSNYIKLSEKYNTRKVSNFLTSKNIRDHNNVEKHRRNRNKILRNKHQKDNFSFEKNLSDKNIKLDNCIHKKSIKNKKESLLKQVFKKPLRAINRNIILSSAISIFNLANKMAVKSSEIIKMMARLGYTVTINQIIDQDIAQLVAEEMGHKVTICYENKLEDKIMRDRDFGDGIKKTRPPIITIMGHVDHGKTSLLDKIRLTRVADSEPGRITQHIGAYHIKINNKIITFLDTPGHSAFTAMRARGAQVTDIVILVIAIDDGIKPQTIEAIQHAQAASVPIIIAINKIDKLITNIEKIKNELTKYNILPEEWGGDNIFVNISAKSGEGIESLLNAILTQSEMLELKSISNGMASGLVIESYLDKGRGPTAIILIKEGKLNKGDIVLCGFEYGKVRSIRDDLENEVNSIGPSIPVKILGLSGIPLAGDKIVVVRDEKQAREVATYRQKKFKEQKMSKQRQLKSLDIFEDVKRSSNPSLNIVIKSDVQGSLEAISYSLLKLSNDEIKINIIGKGVGGITETDVLLAAASNAIIIGFNVRADSSAKRIIEFENVDFRYYSVIYQIIDEIKNCICGMLSPKYQQKIIGLANVRSIFKSPKIGVIAGCIVMEGIIKRNSIIQILRNNVVIHKGELISLRRFKEDVSEVRCGVECGIGMKNFNDICIEDIIEVFETIEIKQ